jgi:hypothetical protein
MTEKEYEYILNPKTGKLVKTCGNIGMKLIKNYEYEEIYNPETKRTVNFNKTTGKKVYKKYEKYIEKYSKKGGTVALAAPACPTSIKLRTCNGHQSSRTCSVVRTLKRNQQQTNNSCSFILPKLTKSGSTLTLQNNHSNYGITQNSTLLYLAPEFSENLNEKLHVVTYSYNYNNTSYKVSSTLSTTDEITVIQNYDPPNPPPPISTSTYQFDCEPSNTNQVCNSSSMQTNETLKKFLQILAAYIDTIVMLLNPQFLSILTVKWLKNVVIEYIFTNLLQLVIPTQIDNKGLLVKSVVWNMMGDNVITISAKLTLKQVAPGYTANLPQVIIKNQVITLLEYVQNLKPERKSELNTEEITKVLKENTKVLKENTKVLEEIKTVNTKVKEIVNTISDNFDIKVTKETHS